jgi:signal transduction histidine kinase
MGMEKDKLTSGYLTHELRAPLTAIRCSLELILDGAQSLNQQERDILTVALRNTAKLNVLIDDIMQLSKIQTGRMAMSPAPMDPAAFTREVVEDMGSWAQRKGLALTVSAPAACRPVFSDKHWTAQSLTNLISNAIKFTPSGGAIEVSVEEGKDEDAGFVVISVRDTGCGIAPGDLRKVFGYFVQVGSPEQRQGGSGLGLALARSMVEIQGGTMRAKSRPGEGSVFSFTLPVYIPSPAVH